MALAGSLMGTLNTAALITSLASGNPGVVSAANKLRVGTMALSTASQLMSRPNMTRASSGSSGSSGPDPRNPNTNAVTAIVRNLESIILRLETSNTYLKAIAEQLSPKVRDQNIKKYIDQNKLMFQAYSTTLGKFLINNFGKEFMRNYSQMNRMFGPALQNGSVSNSQLLMYRAFGNNPFFKQFFGNIESIIQESRDQNEEIKITLKNIIPNKLDAIIHLDRMRNNILQGTQDLIGRIGVALVGNYGNNNARNGNLRSLLDDLRTNRRNQDRAMHDIMRRAMFSLENLNNQVITFRGVLLNILDGPLKLMKTVFSWFVRFKIGQMILSPFFKHFMGTSTGQNAKNLVAGSFLGTGKDFIKGMFGNFKSYLMSDRFSKQVGGFFKSVKEVVVKHYEELKKSKIYQDFISSLKKALVGGIQKLISAATAVFLSYRMARGAYQWVRSGGSNVFESIRDRFNQARENSAQSRSYFGNIVNYIRGKDRDISNNFAMMANAGRDSRSLDSLQRGISSRLERVDNIRREYGQEYGQLFRERQAGNITEDEFNRRSRDIITRLNVSNEYRNRYRSIQENIDNGAYRNMTPQQRQALNNLMQGMVAESGARAARYMEYPDNTPLPTGNDRRSRRERARILRMRAENTDALRDMLRRANVGDGGIDSDFRLDASGNRPRSRYERVMDWTGSHVGSLRESITSSASQSRMFQGFRNGLRSVTRNLGIFGRAVKHSAKNVSGFFGGAWKGVKGIAGVATDIGGIFVDGVTRVFSFASKALNWAGIAVMIGTAVYQGFKRILSWAGKDKDLVNTKDNRSFVQKLLSKTFEFIYTSVFKILGYMFNPSVWKMIVGGLIDGTKLVYKYLGAALIGGALSLIPGDVATKVVNALGLGKQWETISKAFNSTRTQEINAAKMAENAAKDEEEKKRSLEAQEQTAKNTLTMVDYMKPKNLALSFGFGLHKLSKLLSGILGYAGADVTSFENKNIDLFEKMSTSKNNIVSRIGSGGLASIQGKTLQEVLFAEKSNSEATTKNTEAITKNTEELEKLNAEAQAKRNADVKVENNGNSINFDDFNFDDPIAFTHQLDGLDSRTVTKLREEYHRRQFKKGLNKVGGWWNSLREADAKATNAILGPLWKANNDAGAWIIDNTVNAFKALGKWGRSDNQTQAFNHSNDMTGDPVTKDTPPTEIINALKRAIKISEGLRLSPYDDGLHNMTIGYGHKIGKGENFGSITKEKADEIFDSDYNRIYSQIAPQMTFATADPLTKAVLMDMAFNMGPYFLNKFPTLSKAIKEGNFELASNEILSSKYASQVGKRAIRNAVALRTGIFYENRENAKIKEMINDRSKYPSRNGSPIKPPTDEEVLTWLKPVKADVTPDKILKLNDFLKFSLVNYAKDLGRPIEVTSAFRTYAEQEELWRKDSTKAAKPGHSRHEKGNAVDLNSQIGQLDENKLRKHNLYRPFLAKEPWHIETIGDRAEQYGMTGNGYIPTGDDGGTDPLTTFFNTLSVFLTGNVDSMIGDPVPPQMAYPNLRKIINFITKKEMDTDFDIMENNSKLTGTQIGNKVESIGNIISSPIGVAAKTMVKLAEVVSSDKTRRNLENGTFGATNVITNASPVTVMSANSQNANLGNNNSGSSDNIGMLDMGLLAFMI